MSTKVEGIVAASKVCGHKKKWFVNEWVNDQRTSKLRAAAH